MMRLIDADALKDGLIDYQQKYTDSLGDDYWIVENVLLRIEEIPTIDAEPVRHGKWIELNTESGIFMTYDEVKCSECGFVEFFNKGWERFKYCPTCGAKMDEED